MKATACLCGAADAEVLFDKDERLVGQCTACTLVRTLTIPDDYQQLYTDGERYHAERNGHTPYIERENHDYGVAGKRIVRHLGQFRTLDVGTANGAFPRRLRAMGFDAAGLEVNPTMAAWARNYSQTTIYESWHEIRRRFDMITYHDVLEHVEHPARELQTAWFFLNPNGLLVLDTPDADDPRFAELGPNWHHMKPQEHLYFYTEQALRQLLDPVLYYVTAVERPLQGKVVVYARARKLV